MAVQEMHEMHELHEMIDRVRCLQAFNEQVNAIWEEIKQARVIRDSLQDEVARLRDERARLTAAQGEECIANGSARNSRSC